MSGSAGTTSAEVDGSDWDGTGDCFVVAANLVLSLPGDPILVHGRVLGSTGGPLAGVRYWHAWIEIRYSVRHPEFNDVEVSSDVVVDRSNGNDLTVPQALYYKLGDVTETRHYSRAEALARCESTGNYGPWEHTDN